MWHLDLIILNTDRRGTKTGLMSLLRLGNMKATIQHTNIDETSLIVYTEDKEEYLKFLQQIQKDLDEIYELKSYFNPAYIMNIMCGSVSVKEIIDILRPSSDTKDVPL